MTVYPDTLKQWLGIPGNKEIISIFTTSDPLAFTAVYKDGSPNTVVLATELSGLLDLPPTCSVVNIYVNNDPLFFTIVLMSETDFNEVYIEYGGFDPGLSSITINPDFFNPS